METAALTLTGTALAFLLLKKKKENSIGAIYKDIPQNFYPCLDGTYSDHNGNRACTWHGGMVTDEPVQLCDKQVIPAPVIVKEKLPFIPGKEITPNKDIKASKAAAIKDVAPKYDLSEMEAGILLQVATLPEIYIYDYVSGSFHGLNYKPIGLKGAVVLKLHKKGFLDDDYYNDNFIITEKAKQFIDAVNARIETRRAVKAGTDMFPEYANINGRLQRSFYIGNCATLI